MLLIVNNNNNNNNNSRADGVKYCHCNPVPYQ